MTQACGQCPAAGQRAVGAGLAPGLARWRRDGSWWMPTQQPTQIPPASKASRRFQTLPDASRRFQTQHAEKHRQLRSRSVSGWQRHQHRQRKYTTPLM